VKTRRKATRRQGRRHSPKRKKTEKALAAPAGANDVWYSIHVIRASKTRHGPRAKWGRLQYAQAAIAMLYPDVVPDNINQAKLVADVNARLNSDPKYRDTGFGYLPRTTVLRALKVHLAANPGLSVLRPATSNAS
jgi:hypothetical protein